MNSEQEQLHFIGVGGVGMSGIARVAHDQGMAVSGSDIKESRYTKQLRDAGVTVFIGQDGANIPDGDVTVVVSTAILENNPELIEARRRNLPIVHRAQMLARLGRDLDTLAVAGTHGKTTTSSMLASTLDAMGYDPTFLIGGIVRAYGTNAHSGRGRRVRQVLHLPLPGGGHRHEHRGGSPGPLRGTRGDLRPVRRVPLRGARGRSHRRVRR